MSGIRYQLIYFPFREELFYLFQPILAQPHFRMEIVRQGKDPDTPFSAGTIVKVICNKEYKLNLLNPNGTAKCVRGRWKPMTPECILCNVNDKICSLKQ